MEPLLPPHKSHPLGCHNPRVPDRQAMNAILFGLRTGCQWNALNPIGRCSSSSAHRQFMEWTAASVFLAFWREGLSAYDRLQRVDGSWLALDGVMSQAPVAGSEKTGGNPTDRGKQGIKRSVLTDAAGIPRGLVIEGAHRHDMKLVRGTLEAIPVSRPAPTVGRGAYP